MRPDPAAVYRAAPLAELLAILLRQYRRPLASRGIDLTDAQAEALSLAITMRGTLDESAFKLRGALADLVRESVDVLESMHLAFPQSLDTQMSDIPGWETTAEFLEIANEKANAELRISTGAALLLSLGDATYAPELLALAGRGEADDLDGVIAQRVLLLASGIDENDPAWMDKLPAWVQQKHNAETQAEPSSALRRDAE
jgi:hypothetical protein